MPYTTIRDLPRQAQNLLIKMATVTSKVSKFPTITPRL